MKKKVYSILIIICLTFVVGGLIQAEEETIDPNDILVKVDQIRYPIESSFKINCQMFILKDNEVESRKDMEINVMDPEKGDSVLVKFVHPKEDYGKAVLSIGEQNWLYFPQTRKTIRVAPQYSLMGGNFSNGDVTKIRLSQDYTAELVGEEEIFGQATYVLDLKSTNQNALYKHIKLWVTKNGYLPLKQNFYAISGKLYKELIYVEFAEFDDVLRPSKMMMTDAIQQSKKTVLVFKDIIKTELPESMFTRSYLETGQ